MSEKRFFTKINKNGRNVIIDKECHIEIIDLTLACEVLNRLDLKLKTYNEQLGEQQATIRRLQDLCGESDGENAKLRLKNKELQEEIKLLKPVNIEQYEQIVQLQEENEKLRQSQDVKEFSALFNQSIALQREIKDLKDDLHNCRLNKNIISEKLKLWQDVHKEYGIYSIKDFEELMKNDK